ncbi:hypothetical protein CDEST_02049 [Colletotrichum destructivum]|uniref:ARB-07466-like C-terminal domain-containing protein n=1 Tax=Colletotrichum destructivum TaxID=34406 RepID=A0AAX4I0Y7_9PEZI|nr:hypothetical protein CDEST_02049 [Colletotrichum destructivum]
MQLNKILFALYSATATLAAVNEPCYGPEGKAGVCITASSCTSNGGTTINGACPADPATVKCCYKVPCGAAGNCRWTSDCASSSTSGQCPGPSDFKCCQSSANGFGGYRNPPTFHSGGCTKVAMDGAKIITAAFPGRVREVGCKRDSGKTSDHSDGKATDLMCSDITEKSSLSGKEIAEWVMNNRQRLNLKYVIWGQRIWNPKEDLVKPWSSWRSMSDRGNVRENHCLKRIY